MDERYLIDSNVIIDYVSQRLPQPASDFVESLFDSHFLISIIVKIEVLGFSDTPAKMEELKDFLDLSATLPLNDAVAFQTIELRKKYKKIKLADAIIAATAIVHNLILLTRNTDEFKSIENLNIFNPYQMP